MVTKDALYTRKVIGICVIFSIAIITYTIIQDVRRSKDAVVKDESVGTEAHSEEEEPNTTDLDENIVLHLTNDPSITFGISCLPTLTKDSNGYRCTEHGKLGEYEVSVFGYDGLDVYYCARCDVDVIRQILDQHIVGIKEE